jgi:hypothetical protein
MKNLLYILIFSLISPIIIGQTNPIYIPYRIKNKWGLATSDSQVLFKPKFEKTFPSTYDKIRFEKNGKYGFINPNGDVVIKPIYLKATDYYFGGVLYAEVTTSDSTYLIDINGQPIQPVFFCRGSQGTAQYIVKKIKVNDSVGTISFSGDTIIRPIYKQIKSFDFGRYLAVQSFNLKYGVLNFKGDTIHEFNLDSVNISNDQKKPLYYIYQNGKMGVIDSNGTLQANPYYDKIATYTTTSKMRFYIAFRDEKKLGYVYEGKEFWE